MKNQEIVVKTVDELNELMLASKRELFNLRFQKTTGQLQNPARIKVVRKIVARVKTFLNIKKQ